MYNCKNCSAQLPDGANACPYCGAVQQSTNNLYAKIPNTPHDTVFEENKNVQPQHPYGMNPNSFDENQRFYFQQKLTESINDASTAKALGIVTIVCALIPTFIIISWICGAMGLAKANAALNFAQQTGNAQLYSEALAAKSRNKTGLIISAVVACLGVVGIFAFVVIAGALGMAL